MRKDTSSVTTASLRVEMEKLRPRFQSGKSSGPRSGAHGYLSLMTVAPRPSLAENSEKACINGTWHRSRSDPST